MSNSNETRYWVNRRRGEDAQLAATARAQERADAQRKKDVAVNAARSTEERAALAAKAHELTNRQIIAGRIWAKSEAGRLAGVTPGTPEWTEWEKAWEERWGE